MMLKIELGLKPKKRTISVREWMRIYRDTLDVYEETTYPITLIVPPKRYPDALLVFETHDEKVRIRIAKDEWEYFTRIHDIFETDIYSKVVYFSARKNHLGIDLRRIEEWKRTYRYMNDVWRIEDEFAYEYIHATV